MPRSILIISIWNLTSYLKRMCAQTESRAFLFLFFSRRLLAFLQFLDIYIGHTSRTRKKKKEKKKERLSVCWFVHNQHRVKKSHPNALCWAGHGQSNSLAVTCLAQLVRSYCLNTRKHPLGCLLYLHGNVGQQTFDSTFHPPAILLCKTSCACWEVLST